MKKYSNEALIKGFVSTPEKFQGQTHTGYIYTCPDYPKSLWNFGKHYRLCESYSGYYLVNINGYSVTTGKHKGMLMAEIPTNLIIEFDFHKTDGVKECIQRTLKRYREAMEQIVKQEKKGRKGSLASDRRIKRHKQLTKWYKIVSSWK